MIRKLLFFFILLTQIAEAQSPQSFKYQSVVRDASGVLAANRIISIRTSILAGSATGSSVYTETQTLSTNDYGVVSLNIGAGTVVSGNFTTINWGATDYFVKTELDINGGSTYIFMGTSQILSVPYALYAEKAGSSLNDHDTSSANELQTLSIAGHNLSISSGNTITIPQDSLSVNGYSIGISNGNTVNLPAPQTVSIIGDSLHISNGNTIYLSGAVDLDSDPTNELQNLTLHKDTLKISRTNTYVVFPHDNDRDSTNELQNLSINQGTIHISKGNSISLPDSSATNELQNLYLNHGTLSISQGNTVHLPDSSATNELQNISVTNDTLINITQGNSTHINTTRSLKYPEGIDGIPVSQFGSGTYTVPSGYNFYSIQDGGNGLNSFSFGLAVFPPGTQVSIYQALYGILVKRTPNIQIVNATITNPGLTYTVPSGKTLFIKSFSSGFATQVTIGGIVNSLSIGTNNNDEPIILPAGAIISNGNTGSSFFTGYLK